ncbi:photosystem II cytochrome c-550 [Thermosynechococcaceae cyanobacterium BACA0444]|uniref:Photosystem II extrinsic protein V n=1 Tax=Pseudocalidococcus azoricus BACA0444 TaxID=2918990 RepID=A0AAE4JVR0_9CYAN|nr:photosystem II cytochrome c-550 [Pseudocalidococcus azoricus]MDS3860321.1 photosystem II cytochrome c-550 [Pseudocalidococcus azoricus BACA0444]
MLRRCFWLAAALILCTWQVLTGTALAAELTADVLTVPFDSQGKSITLTKQQYEEGQRLFNYACATCHVGGVTKTNPSLDLATETLALATPPRDSITGLVDYMKDPTTYDGEESIAEVHPSLKSADIFPKMRNLTDKDLADIAGHILVAPKILGEKWGGGKVYY